MSMYHSKKITVRFTQEEHAAIMEACKNNEWMDGKTPSRFIRRLVKLEFGRRETLRRQAEDKSDKTPAECPTSPRSRPGSGRPLTPVVRR